MTTSSLRPIILALLAALSAVGFISPEVRDIIANNADAILTGVFAVWAVVEHLLHRKAQKTSAAPTA